MAELKRKRTSEKDDRPSKKAAVSAPSTAIKISLVSEQDELPPVIASTPGIAAPHLAFTPYHNLPANGPHAQTTFQYSNFFLHSSSHPRLDYTARPESSNAHLSHYVGIYDPSSSSLKLVPAPLVTLRSTLRQEALDAPKDNQARSFGAQREELGMEFGTKKARKAIASKTENAIAPRGAKTTNAEGTPIKKDAVTEAVLDTVANASANMPGRDELADAAFATKPIPRPNLSATSPAEVYPLSVLVPPADLRSIFVKEWQDKVAADEEITTGSRFVSFRVAKVVGEGDVKKMKALRYMLLLLQWNDALRPAGRDGGKKLGKKEEMVTKMSEWNEGLIDGVRKRFAEGGELNKWHVDNLMTHIAALSLYIDDWATDTTNLKDDLRLDNKQMNQYFHELGCRVQSLTDKERESLKIASKAAAAQHRIAKLKIPLDFPKVRRPAAKRRF
ncbi:DNA-directed RNA polymerase I subunit rpa49 [Elasticomyces elasticus]|nr:DNA-directed RNA polymerase I subunit rpa49 [Elasticomyces elasticus]